MKTEQCKRTNLPRSSYKEHRVDALAPGAEEGRGKLRKASGSRKQALNRGFPNGATRPARSRTLAAQYIKQREATGGTETSKYPEEKKENSIPSVAASERGRAQTQHLCVLGVADMS